MSVESTASQMTERVDAGLPPSTAIIITTKAMTRPVTAPWNRLECLARAPATQPPVARPVNMPTTSPIPGPDSTPVTVSTPPSPRPIADAASPPAATPVSTAPMLRAASTARSCQSGEGYPGSPFKGSATFEVRQRDRHAKSGRIIHPTNSLTGNLWAGVRVRYSDSFGKRGRPNW